LKLPSTTLFRFKVRDFSDTFSINLVRIQIYIYFATGGGFSTARQGVSVCLSLRGKFIVSVPTRRISFPLTLYHVFHTHYISIPEVAKEWEEV